MVKKNASKKKKKQTKESPNRLHMCRQDKSLTPAGARAAREGALHYSPLRHTAGSYCSLATRTIPAPVIFFPDLSHKIFLLIATRK